MDLNLQRYDRHLRLKNFGREKQEKLRQSTVLLVGVGGLGSPIALYLAAAGVGHLILVDDDSVDLSNLQRQVLFKTSDVGQPKVAVAARELKAFNPDLEITTHHARFTPENASSLLSGVDVVIDGADNFPTRYLINDAAFFAGIPVVHGSVHHFEGHVTVFHPPGGPCYRCLFPEPPPPHLAPSCAEAGVLGVLPGTIGLLQATEALKLIAGIGEPLIGTLLCWDALDARQTRLAIHRDPGCPLCGEQPSIHRLKWTGDTCATPAFTEIAPEAYATWRRSKTAHLLLDVRDAGEVAIDSIQGSFHIPLSQLPYRLDEIENDPNLPIVCHCLSGKRSQTALGLIAANRSNPLYNLTDGISGWRLQFPVRETEPT